MRELELDATLENLAKVFDFLKEAFDIADMRPRTEREIKMCVEEMYINITRYAYTPQIGTATIGFAIDKDNAPPRIIITLSDSGKPYDPLQHEDPDLDLELDDMPIGGLGIFLVKETMDSVRYELKNGKNILTMEKMIV